MAHISSIGAGMYSDLAVATPATDFTAATLAALDTSAEFQALFATEIDTIGGTKAAGAFVRIKNVRVCDRSRFFWGRKVRTHPSFGWEPGSR